MTTWAAPQLLPGAFEVPVPTVLIAPWQLTARVDLAHLNLSDDVDEDESDQDTFAGEELVEQQLLTTAGFARVVAANQWSSVGPAYPLTVYRHHQHGLNIAILPGNIASLIPIGLSNPTWDEAAARAGRVMVATADLPSYWNEVEQGRFLTFQEPSAKVAGRRWRRSTPARKPTSAAGRERGSSGCSRLMMLPIY